VQRRQHNLRALSGPQADRDSVNQLHEPDLYGRAALQKRQLVGPVRFARDAWVLQSINVRLGHQLPYRRVVITILMIANCRREAGFVPFGVDFKNPNFAKVAEAMGAKGIRLEEPGDVKDSLAEALAYSDGPVVVDAVVDRFALSLPSHVPVHTFTGYTLSMAKQVLSGHMDTVIKTIERNVDLI